jgi:hypothetical protein
MKKKYYYYDMANNKYYFNTLKDIRKAIKEIYNRTAIKPYIYIEKI